MIVRIIKRNWREEIRRESGASTFRALLIAILLTMLFGQTFLWARGMIVPDPNRLLQEPTTSPFVFESVGLPKIRPETPAPPFDRLLAVVNYLQTKSYVPYVYGGKSIGPANICRACSECIMAKRLPANSSPARSAHCGACRSCGIDCSNFVNRVFDEADMGYRFADTKTLLGVPDASIENSLGFVNVGNRLEDAKPGDVLLQSNHVMLLLAIDPVNHTFDYIHASRGSRRTPVGGIERVRSADMFKIGRHLEKILRHRELIETEDHAIPLSQALLKEIQNLSHWRV